MDKKWWYFIGGVVAGAFVIPKVVPIIKTATGK